MVFDLKHPAECTETLSENDFIKEANKFFAVNTGTQDAIYLNSYLEVVAKCANDEFSKVYASFVLLSVMEGSGFSLEFRGGIFTRILITHLGAAINTIRNAGQYRVSIECKVSPDNSAVLGYTNDTAADAPKSVGLGFIEADNIPFVVSFGRHINETLSRMPSKSRCVGDESWCIYFSKPMGKLDVCLSSEINGGGYIRFFSEVNARLVIEYMSPEYLQFIDDCSKYD